MKIKGILKKVDSACWSDDRGNDKLGYAFYITGKDKGFCIDKKTKTGIFFSENYKKMIDNEIEFSCDEWGYKVRIDKNIIEKYS